jgi:hypothetical protein
MLWVRDKAGLTLVGTAHYEIRQIRQLIEEQKLGSLQGNFHPGTPRKQGAKGTLSQCYM